MFFYFILLLNNRLIHLFKVLYWLFVNTLEISEFSYMDTISNNMISQFGSLFILISNILFELTSSDIDVPEYITQSLDFAI